MNRSILTLSTFLFVAGRSQPSSPAPELPDPGADGTYAVDWPDLGRDEDRYITIETGADTFETCRRISPKFPFDSARTRAQDRVQLRALATCLNHPEMADRTLLLVGRTDAEGGDAYNKDLGMKRAERIKELLVESGVAPARISVKSAGEMGAVGDKPEYSHGFDRRVDVTIIGGSHAP
jgi:outer membrane protein OmpA-like peptidoglycan-associated protein